MRLGAGLPWEEIWWGPNIFLLWEVSSPEGEWQHAERLGMVWVLSLDAAGLALALWVGGACVREGGRAGRISSLQRWLLG